VVDGKLWESPKAKYRCYAASSEVVFKSAFESHWRNWETIKKLKTPHDIATAMFAALPPDCRILRFHSFGDFFSQRYFDGCVELATLLPDVTFYCYTKAIPFWVKRLGQIPPNFFLTASMGGKYDRMAEENKLRRCWVVFSPEEAERRGLPIDTEDVLVSGPGGDFCLLIHGCQKAGSPAMRASLDNRKLVLVPSP
jgi:hypothetical protein